MRNILLLLLIAAVTIVVGCKKDTAPQLVNVVFPATDYDDAQDMPGEHLGTAGKGFDGTWFSKEDESGSYFTIDMQKQKIFVVWRDTFIPLDFSIQSAGTGKMEVVINEKLDPSLAYTVQFFLKDANTLEVSRENGWDILIRADKTIDPTVQQDIVPHLKAVSQ